MADDPTTPVVVDPVDPVVDPPDPTTADNPLGPEGEKALQAWKDRAKKAEADAKRANDLQAKLDALEAANLSDQDKALKEAADAARAEGRSEVQAATNSKLFRSELRAATAGKLNDAAIKDLLTDVGVATKLLGLDEIPVTADGDIDSEAISQAVATYVEARPFLAASATQTPGSIDQGARTTTTAVKSVSEQIAEAEKAGDVAGSIALKSRQLAELRAKNP